VQTRQQLFPPPCLTAGSHHSLQLSASNILSGQRSPQSINLQSINLFFVGPLTPSSIMKAQNPALDHYIPSSYAMDPERANAASSSSNNPPRAGSRYRDEDPPAYEETPLIPKIADGRQQSAKPQPEIRRRLCQ